jgi:hypothetical protein
MYTIWMKKSHTATCMKDLEQAESMGLAFVKMVWKISQVQVSDRL